MGQAKKRGTFEERKANPLGTSPLYNYWTEERKKAFIESFRKDAGEMIDSIRKSLFSPCKPRKKKARRIKTGG